MFDRLIRQVLPVDPVDAGSRLHAMTTAHPNTTRVAQALRDAGAVGEVRSLEDSTRTAQEAATALGVPVGAIVKSLVFTADGAAVLVLASGDHQVDLSKVAAALSADAVNRADADTVRAATGYPIGGVAPLAHPQPLRTLVDTHLASYDVLWAAAGTPHSVFPTSYDELVRLTTGEPADIAAR
jgi:prolyl-tRNA editing enzyme YbaK/EbsC (Cys-tRNA(Pro) deacylase)